MVLKDDPALADHLQPTCDSENIVSTFFFPSPLDGYAHVPGTQSECG